VQPISTISGTVKLPGSKSLSNRILLLAALAEGTTVVKNLLVRLTGIGPQQQQQQGQQLL
jgi:5-enolpyruvylshikimate-3-phosphate synthase